MAMKTPFMLNVNSLYKNRGENKVKWQRKKRGREIKGSEIKRLNAINGSATGREREVKTC